MTINKQLQYTAYLLYRALFPLSSTPNRCSVLPTARIGATNQHEIHQNGSLPLHTITPADIIHTAQQWKHYMHLPPASFSLLAKMSGETEREYWRRSWVSMKYPTVLKTEKTLASCFNKGTLPCHIQALKKGSKTMRGKTGAKKGHYIHWLQDLGINTWESRNGQ